MIASTSAPRPSGSTGAVDVTPGRAGFFAQHGRDRPRVLDQVPPQFRATRNESRLQGRHERVQAVLEQRRSQRRQVIEERVKQREARQSSKIDERKNERREAAEEKQRERAGQRKEAEEQRKKAAEARVTQSGEQRVEQRKKAEETRHSQAEERRKAAQH